MWPLGSYPSRKRQQQNQQQSCWSLSLLCFALLRGTCKSLSLLRPRPSPLLAVAALHCSVVVVSYWRFYFDAVRSDFHVIVKQISARSPVFQVLCMNGSVKMMMFIRSLYLQSATLHVSVSSDDPNPGGSVHWWYVSACVVVRSLELPSKAKGGNQSALAHRLACRRFPVIVFSCQYRERIIPSTNRQERSPLPRNEDPIHACMHTYLDLLRAWACPPTSDVEMHGQHG